MSFEVEEKDWMIDRMSNKDDTSSKVQHAWSKDRMSLPFIAFNNLISIHLYTIILVWQRRGLTLHESTHNGFLQIMHPRTFHIKNPSDARLASLSILRKWPVSMAITVKNLKKSNISVHIQAIFTTCTQSCELIHVSYILRMHGYVGSHNNYAIEDNYGNK